MKCTDLLFQDHKIILRCLDVLEHMAARVQNDQPFETEDLQAVLRFLRTFTDDHHQTKEESALFPELRRTSAAQEGPLRHMLFEHDQERSLVEGRKRRSAKYSNHWRDVLVRYSAEAEASQVGPHFNKFRILSDNS